jgi:hypothetical protein
MTSVLSELTPLSFRLHHSPHVGFSGLRWLRALHQVEAHIYSIHPLFHCTSDSAARLVKQRETSRPSPPCLVSLGTDSFHFSCWKRLARQAASALPTRSFCRRVELLWRRLVVLNSSSRLKRRSAHTYSIRILRSSIPNRLARQLSLPSFDAQSDSIPRRQRDAAWTTGTRSRSASSEW